MDFIERVLGIAPDGGSGTLEFALFAIPLCGIAIVAMTRWVRRRTGAG